MNIPTVLNPADFSTSAHLVIPSRLNELELTFLLKEWSGREVSLLVEQDTALPDAFQRLVVSRSLNVISFSSAEEEESLTAVGGYLREQLGSTGVALFLPPYFQMPGGRPVDLPSGLMQSLCALGVPLCPVTVHRPAENQLRCDPIAQNPEAIFTYGELLTGTALTVTTLYDQFMRGAERAFSSRRFLSGSLAAALLTSLHQGKKKGNTVIDGTDGSELPFRKLLAASLALSDRIIKQTSRKRVGIILPAGKGGMIANLAVLFAGKIPVNLNFTSALPAVNSAISQADLDLFITANPVLEKVPDFPWNSVPHTLLLDELVPQLKPTVALWMLKLKVFSAAALIQKRGLNLKSGRDEAILLFTSGSSGAPKGVPLSHQNILANICQFGTSISARDDMVILASLPLFHSFGCTATTFFPLLEGYDVVTYPNPLDAKRIGELVEQHKVTLLTATPTFLRGYLKRVQPHQLASLHYVITAAEKLPPTLRDQFHKRFQIMPYEGYGLTETSPASHLNVLPVYPTPEDGAPVTMKKDSVGQALIGVAMRTTDPLTDVPTSLTEGGCLWLKGANVFTGYLQRPELNAETIDPEGWFRTGDIGRMDKEGFLTLQGRLSRFSKIAGEMVPHETVEEEIVKALHLTGEETRLVAVVGQPCEKKGEQLVLLSTLPQSTSDDFLPQLKRALLKQSIPALWCPKVVIQAEHIPILGSGKLDIAACYQLVHKEKECSI